MKVVALAGGTGSAKVLRGLAPLGSQLTVVANVGDNVWMHGLYVCPDIDIAMYTLAGLANKERGWGVEGDTFTVLKQLGRLGEDTWFGLGDKDLATHIIRSKELDEGKTLTEVTERLCRRFKVGPIVLPATDSEVETRVVTKAGEMSLQEFWVKQQGKPAVTGVHYRGVASSHVTEKVKRAIQGADKIVLCPANPVTSIGPILAVPGLREGLSSSPARVSALSPMSGRSAFSGPAAKLMRAMGTSPDSVGVAGLYLDFLDGLIIGREDIAMRPAVEKLGIACHLSDTRLDSPSDEHRLARELLEA